MRRAVCMSEWCLPVTTNLRKSARKFRSGQAASFTHFVQAQSTSFSMLLLIVQLCGTRIGHVAWMQGCRTQHVGCLQYDLWNDSCCLLSLVPVACGCASSSSCGAPESRAWRSCCSAPSFREAGQFFDSIQACSNPFVLTNLDVQTRLLENETAGPRSHVKFIYDRVYSPARMIAHLWLSAFLPTCMALALPSHPDSWQASTR